MNGMRTLEKKWVLRSEGNVIGTYDTEEEADRELSRLDRGPEESLMNYSIRLEEIE